MSFHNGTFLLYDDDCGICTKFSKILRRLLTGRTRVLPMHLDSVESEGMQAIPEDYWKSFHIVLDGNWYTEGEAIIALATIFPLGNILGKIAQFPPIYSFLKFFLRTMQYQRKLECKIDF